MKDNLAGGLNGAFGRRSRVAQHLRQRQHRLRRPAARRGDGLQQRGVDQAVVPLVGGRIDEPGRIGARRRLRKDRLSRRRGTWRGTGGCRLRRGGVLRFVAFRRMGLLGVSGGGHKTPSLCDALQLRPFLCIQGQRRVVTQKRSRSLQGRAEGAAASQFVASTASELNTRCRSFLVIGRAFGTF